MSCVVPGNQYHQHARLREGDQLGDPESQHARELALSTDAA
jgi:hypothetical protein